MTILHDISIPRSDEENEISEIDGETGAAQYSVAQPQWQRTFMENC